MSDRAKVLVELDRASVAIEAETGVENERLALLVRRLYVLCLWRKELADAEAVLKRKLVETRTALGATLNSRFETYSDDRESGVLLLVYTRLGRAIDELNATNPDERTGSEDAPSAPPPSGEQSASSASPKD